jgi:membrane AbrB-like protein
LHLLSRRGRIAPTGNFSPWKAGLTALPPVRFAPLAKLPRAVQWTVLLAGSVILSGLLELAGLLAALLLGAMVAAILAGTGGGALRVPRPTYYMAQVVIGCMVARVITPVIVGTFLKEWPLFLSVMLTVVVASSLLGWGLGRLGLLPGTTAVWGLSPGAANVMMLMAEAYGADIRLVAFMQYLRVVFVAIAASVLARFVVHAHGGTAAPVIWFPLLHWVSFGETVAIGLLGGIVGRLSRIPAGVLLVPMFAGAILHGTGLVTIELPPWLLAISYTFLGWNIGLGFTCEILVHAARVLPQTVLAILILMLLCGGLAFILVKAAGIDPLTAYLATSPGGMDSAAIIAASAKVDVSFVMALQTVRFMVVLLVGPAISRFVANKIGHRVPKDEKKVDTDRLLARVKEDEDELD